MSQTPFQIIRTPRPSPAVAETPTGSAGSQSAAIAEPSVGQVYRHLEEWVPDIEIVRRLRDFGYARIGIIPTPLPVVGRVWVGHIEMPIAGTVEILCTAEGLADRGYALTDITERPSE